MADGERTTGSSGTPRPPRRGRRALATIAASVALALLGVTVGWQAGLLPDDADRRLDAAAATVGDAVGDAVGGLFGDDARGDLPDVPAGPGTLPPPEGVDAPEVRVPDPVAQPSAPTTALDEAAVRRALRGLRDPVLGRHVLAAVAPLDGDGAGATVRITRGAGARGVPASTTKLVTSLAALLALGPDTRFTTRVVGRPGAGDGPPVLTLVGGGDPFLQRDDVDAGGTPWAYPPRATLSDLAARTASALAENDLDRVRLTYDTSLFTGPAENPAWEPLYVDSGEVSPIAPLWIDEGRPPSRLGRVADAPAEAAAAFAAELAAQGVSVVGPVREARAARDTAPVAAVTGPAVGQIVERLLEVSDNEAAEVLLRHVGLAVAGEGSSRAGVAAVRAVLAEAGVDLGASRLLDGSGLSRRNDLAPEVLLDVLRLAASPDRPELGPLLAGLPVAGVTGSLATRFLDAPPAARGGVRAKTGTLSGVTALAGLAQGPDGATMVFVLIADAFRPEVVLEARAALDAAAAALAACRCGATGG